jgi:hypothetical protein
MDTAFTASGSSPASAPALEGSTLLERISRRSGLALLAWSRMVEHRHSREYLAELHERRQEAERLREERFRDVALSRLL